MLPHNLRLLNTIESDHLHPLLGRGGDVQIDRPTSPVALGRKGKTKRKTTKGKDRKEVKAQASATAPTCFATP